jgi:hypothetical protein
MAPLVETVARKSRTGMAIRLERGRGTPMTMTTYRFLWLDEKGHLPKSMQIECGTDHQAIDIAQHQTGNYVVIEVWGGPRSVGRCVNPDQAERRQEFGNLRQ